MSANNSLIIKFRSSVSVVRTKVVTGVAGDCIAAAVDVWEEVDRL